MFAQLQEYSLPLLYVPNDIFDDAERQWLRLLVGLGAQDIDQVLLDRWGHVQGGGCLNLARMVQKGRAHSIIVANELSWLKVQLSRYIATAKGLHIVELYIRRPFCEEEAARCLKHFDLNENTRSDLITFLRDFGGLRDREPGHSGCFLEPPKVDAVGDLLEGCDLREAAKFPILYDSLNGDVLGVFPDGRTGWYCVEDAGCGCPVRPFGKGMNDTITKWVECNDWVSGAIYFDDAWKE